MTHQRVNKSFLHHNRLKRTNTACSRRYSMLYGRKNKLRSTRKYCSKKADFVRLAKYTQGEHYEYEKAPFPMCFTKSALNKLLKTIGKLPPESGSKGFSHKDKMGFDVVEFDEKGSAKAYGVIYSPDVEWGEERRKFYLNKPEKEMRLWSGDLHRPF